MVLIYMKLQNGNQSDINFYRSIIEGILPRKHDTSYIRLQRQMFNSICDAEQ